MQASSSRTISEDLHCSCDPRRSLSCSSKVRSQSSLVCLNECWSCGQTCQHLAGVIQLSGIKVEAPGALRRKRALPDSSDDESIPEDWAGCNFTPLWQTAVEQQETLTVTDVHSSTCSTGVSWNYPETRRERQYYTVFKDLHDKG